MKSSFSLGPAHPGVHGVLWLEVETDGDIVRKVVPHLGFMHRGIEKLAESKEYMQLLPYMGRVDYLAPLSWEELFLSATERAMEIEVGEGAQYARMALLELQRIASHMLWLDSFCRGIAGLSEFHVLEDRMHITNFLDGAAGQGSHSLKMGPGGLFGELPKGFCQKGIALADYVEDCVHEYRSFLEGNQIFLDSTRNVGVLSLRDAIALGASGPVLRASGLKEDSRLSAPYYFYKALELDIPTQSRCDALGRYRIRMEEMVQSSEILRQALEAIPGRKLKGTSMESTRSIAHPEPVLISRELPRGEGLVYMVPGRQGPYRLSLRSPSFANLAALSKICENARLEDIPVIVGSLDLALPEIER